MEKTKQEKLIETYEYLRSIGKIHTKKELAKEIDVNYKNVSSAFNGNESYLTDGFFGKICNRYDFFDVDYYVKDEGTMLKSDSGVKFYDPENVPAGKRLIPFYDDVASVGGNNEIAASLNGVSAPSDYIDTGDWFKNATAAIRHYGESMVEYPPGCILALKEVLDRELIIPGYDYMIETSEYRVTKRVQKGKDADHITAYSTNSETYPDGRLIHEPFDIPWRLIRHIALVLGYVVKKGGGTIVFSNSKK